MSEDIKMPPCHKIDAWFKDSLERLWKKFGTTRFPIDEAFGYEKDQAYFKQQARIFKGAAHKGIYLNYFDHINCSLAIEEAINHNEGKPRPSFVLVDTPKALAEEIKVAEIGAKEYGRDNWKGGGEDFLADNLDSIFRHVLAYSQGQEIDPKSGCHHLAHVRRRCAIALELELNK